MKNAKLIWRTHDTGINFQLLDNSNKPIALDRWGLYTIIHDRGKGNVSALLSFYNDGLAEGHTDTIALSHDQVAKLSDLEVRQLGLPSLSPFRLQVKGKGQLARPDFSLSCSLLTDKGLPALGLTREGALCSFAGNQYLLLDPLYSLVTGIEDFNQQKFPSIDDQMIAWGHLQKLLPEDAVVDNQLRTVTIVRADHFTLDVEADSNFSPALLHSETEPVNDEHTVAPVLPEATNTGFLKQFKGRKDVRQYYGLGAGWYLVLPPLLQQALQVVRNAQDKDRTERKAFLGNPMAYIRKELLRDDCTPEEEESVENLFHETKEFLSERIVCLGEWEPKLCAYRLQTGNQWLTDEEALFNIPAGDKVYEISKGQAEKILSGIKDAAASENDSFEFEGKHYPVTPEFIESLERLTRTREDTEKIPETKTAAPFVPIIKDNIEDGGFQAAKKNKRGVAGGLPGVLKTRPLYEHQQDGLLWLQSHWAQGTPGVLLADDMGLGKTLQALSFMAWVAEAMKEGIYQSKPFLVVAPTGLLKNWQDEAGKHLYPPGLGRMLEGFGSSLRSFKGLSLLQRRQRLESTDWVLTTYETLRDKIQYFIPIEWGITIFDEAQKIKNPVSRMTEMAKSLASDFTVILTGTPVENELKDLWCIMDTAHPGYLGSLKEFHEKYAKPARENLDVAYELQDSLLNNSVPAIMLRRMKEDHLQGLPEKKSVVQHETMPKKQAMKYSGLVAEAKTNRGTPGAMLKAIQQLRNCSLIASEIHEEGLTDDIVSESARLKATIEILDRIKQNGDKALVFLESLKLQELLIPYLQKRYDMARPPLRISGKDSGKSRKQRVDTFQNDPDGEFDVMVLSPKAGGVGLTLTAANHVIHLSRWWNPAVEDQCTDRVFRIGQQKPVYVYYPMAIHPSYQNMSFDQNLHNLLEKKRELSRKVLLPPTMTKDDYKDLLHDSIGLKSDG